MNAWFKSKFIKYILKLINTKSFDSNLLVLKSVESAVILFQWMLHPHSFVLFTNLKNLLIFGRCIYSSHKKISVYINPMQNSTK